MFFDPSVPYGLQFDEPGADRGGGEVMGFAPTRNGTRGSKASAERKKTRKTRMDSVADASDDTSSADDAAKVSAKPTVVKPDGGKEVGKEVGKSGASSPAGVNLVPGPTQKTAPRLVDTSANDSAKVVSLDQFRKK